MAGRHPVLPSPLDPVAAAYRQLVGEGWECPHGLPAGHLVRPWAGSPGCALCRRAGSPWLTVGQVLADRADMASARLRHPSALGADHGHT